MKRLILLSALAATTANAQTITKPLGKEPGLNWRLGAEIAYDDNVFRTVALDESDSFLGIQPELAWFGYSGPNQFDVAFKGDFRRYNEQDVADFDAWGVRGHALLDHSIRFSTDYVLAYDDGVEKIGETDQLFVPGQGPNDYERWNGAFKATYGAKDAAGQLRAQLRYNEQRFQNNNQEFRDADTSGITGTFFYRVAPRTRLLLEVDYTDFDFVQTDAFGTNQSGDQTQLLGGVTWEATGNTTGEFRIGYRDRTFDADNFEDLSGLALALNMTWTPSELTTVTLTANEDNQSSAVQGVGGFVRTGFGATYTRSTSARSRLVADVTFDTLEFEGGFNRSDDRWRAGVGFEYDMTSRLSTRLEYRYEDRDSSFALFNFEASVLLLSFTLTPPA